MHLFRGLLSEQSSDRDFDGKEIIMCFQKEVWIIPSIDSAVSFVLCDTQNQLQLHSRVMRSVADFPSLSKSVATGQARG